MFLATFDRGLQIIIPEDKPFIITLKPDVRLEYVQVAQPLPTRPTVLVAPRSFAEGAAFFPISFNGDIELSQQWETITEVCRLLSPVYANMMVIPVIFYDDDQISLGTDKVAINIMET